MGHDLAAIRIRVDDHGEGHFCDREPGATRPESKDLIDACTTLFKTLWQPAHRGREQGSRIESCRIVKYVRLEPG
jgi:hypothetical protein